MSKERRRSPSPPPEEALRLQPIVDPLTAEALVAAARTYIEPDNTVIFHKGTAAEYRTSLARPNQPTLQDTDWADIVLRIADTLYTDLKNQVFDPEESLRGVAWFLTAYTYDPSLITAAVSMIPAPDDGYFRPPQNATSGDWKPRIAALRQR